MTGLAASSVFTAREQRWRSRGGRMDSARTASVHQFALAWKSAVWLSNGHLR